MTICIYYISNYKGFGLYHEENGNIKKINFNLIGDFSQDAFSVIRAFRMMRNQEFFRRIDKKKYFIWCDCGKHFRCSEMMHYLMKELAEIQISVNFNFFAESHGKNNRDQHFSSIAKFLKQAENKVRLTNTKDIINAIEHGQSKANFIRKLRSKNVFFVF